MIVVGGASTNVAGMAEGLSQPEDSYEESSYLIPPPGEIQEEFHSTTLAFNVVANTVAVITRVLASTQTTDTTTSSGARESSIATLGGRGSCGDVCT